ncbi:MAG: hypothetical protein ACLFSB_16615 [Chitinispirillaceae bacterium]
MVIKLGNNLFSTLIMVAAIMLSCERSGQSKEKYLQEDTIETESNTDEQQEGRDSTIRPGGDTTRTVIDACDTISPLARKSWDNFPTIVR